MSIQAISAFAANPDNYILQLTSKQGTLQYHVLKKGIWTWIKIHVGSILRIFDKKSVLLSEIARNTFQNGHPRGLTPAQLQSFYDALDYKILRWRKRYPQANSIATKNFRPDKVVLKLPSTQKFSWLYENEITATKSIGARLKTIPDHYFVETVNVQDFVATVNVQGSKIAKIVTLSFYKENFQGFPNLEKILPFFNGDNFGEGLKEMQKIAGLKLKRCYLIVKEIQKDGCSVEIGMCD